MPLLERFEVPGGMPCSCPCDRSVPPRQHGLDMVPRQFTKRCECNTCGRPGENKICHVRVDCRETYCWVCELSWKQDDEAFRNEAPDSLKEKSKGKRKRKQPGSKTAETSKRKRS